MSDYYRGYLTAAGVGLVCLQHWSPIVTVVTILVWTIALAPRRTRTRTPYDSPLPPMSYPLPPRTHPPDRAPSPDPAAYRTRLYGRLDRTPARPGNR